MPDDLNDAGPIPVDPPPAPPGDAGWQARVDQLEKQVADYKLLLADNENSKKRLAADYDRQRKYAAEGLIKDLLVALDNLDRAAEAAKKAGDAGPLAQGVAATMAALLDVLKRHGVTRIDVAPGAAFDANVHQAVMQQPSADHPPGAVTAVFQHGFLLHDRVIRPASVAVATEQ